MPQQLKPKVPTYLGSKLSPRGRSSFEVVCESMCARSVSGTNQTRACCELAFWFAFLATSEVELQDRRSLRLRPLDSYKSALGGITLGDLRRSEAQTKALIHTINRLKRAPLVRDLYLRGSIPAGDALGNVDFAFDASQFDTLLKLRDLAKQILGDPRKPRKHDFDSDLSRIYRLIHQYSQRWLDERVADILNDLFPKRAEPFTQSGLKQWRYSRGLTGRK